MKRHPDYSTEQEWARTGLVVIMAVLAFLCFMSYANAQDKTEIESVIRSVAVEQGFDPELALAIAQVESGLNPEAVGELGEVGVYQLRPEFHQGAEGDLKQHVETALRYLTKLKLSCSAYGEAYFICFNLGESKRVRYPTRFPYYVKVMQAKRRLAVGN